MAEAKYGPAHQRERAVWAQRIVNGARPTCPRCGYPVMPKDKWHLDHEDNGVTYRGPAHEFCNTSAGGKRGQQLAKRRKAPSARQLSREW